MAYQTRRDPLLDHGMQAMIEKRSRELIGIALLVVGAMAAAMMLSYTPDDPTGCRRRMRLYKTGWDALALLLLRRCL